MQKNTQKTAKKPSFFDGFLIAASILRIVTKSNAFVDEKVWRFFERWGTLWVTKNGRGSK